MLLDRYADTEEIMHDFRELGYSMDDDEIESWLDSDAGDPGFQLMTDDEICKFVLTKSGEHEENDVQESEEDAQVICPVTNSEAAHMLEKCLLWLEHQPEASVYNTSNLKELHKLAVRKRLQSMRQRTLPEMISTLNKQ
jgi:hypothetical protein